MKKLTVMLGLVSLVSLGLLGTGSASAAPPDSFTCESGAIPGDTYSKVIVEGPDCFFDGDVTINGGLTVRAGAVLNDHAFPSHTAVVNGTVIVGEGAVLGLGQYGAPGISTDTVVNGNIVASRPLSLYISGITVNGNVTSSGGVTPVEFRNFPFKDNTVHGNLTIQGWQGGWFGVIRAHVDGNVTIVNNESVLSLEDPECQEVDPSTCVQLDGVDPDSTEIQTNVIGGNLACFNNIPEAQVNALDGGQPNAVAGQKLGECADL